jgi:uncharacterized damage-inducible protein DinB
MISTEDMVAAYARNLSIIKRQTEGLTHADSLVQPPCPGNCLNWVLGHIATDRNQMLALLGKEPIFTPEQTKRYGYGSQPVCAEGPDVIKLDDLLAKLEQAQERIAEGLRSLTEADLAKEAKSHLGTTTLGQLIFFRYFHETMHTGQTELLRELAHANAKSF